MPHSTTSDPALPATPGFRIRASLLAVVLLAALLAPLTPGVAEVSDTISVVKEGEMLTNAEIVARLAEATFSGQTNRVLIGREDEFADSVASAVMQGDAPLLLVPTDGPISDRVGALLDEYSPSEIVLLGGPAAISESLESELAQDYTVVRRSGPTRIETAIDIADNEAPTADTAILARSTAAAGAGDASQAFADSLAAGGWAANEGWPILLSQTDVLTASVATYLESSQIRNVMIMGGTAAISADVESSLQLMGIATTRLAGPTRFDTAIEVANARGVMTASDAERVVLVEGQSDDAWAGGFAAAAHSATFDAPVVLSNGEGLPASTGTFLSGGSTFAQDAFFANAVLTCVAAPRACDLAREARGLPAEADVTFGPGSGSTVGAGDTVTVETTGRSGTATLTGECITTIQGTAPGTIAAQIGTFDGECTVTQTLEVTGEPTQVDSATYTVEPGGGQGVSGIVTLVEGPGYAWVPPGNQELLVELGVDDTYTVDGASAEQSTFLAQLSTGDLVTQANAAGFAGTAPVNHSLTNREPNDYTSGVVGNVNLVSGSFSIIEPVSGISLNSFLFRDGVFAVGGTDTPRAAFVAAISEGDTISVGSDAGSSTYSLTNNAIGGPVVEILRPQTGTATSFRIGSGGLPGSPMIGDDPDNSENDLFVARPTMNGTPVFTVDGSPADYGQFTSALGLGENLTYSRAMGIETFALVNSTPARTAYRRRSGARRS